LKRIKVDLFGTRPVGLTVAVWEAVRSWMQEEGVGEVWFEAMGPVYTIRFNAAEGPVPGVYLHASDLGDPRNLLEGLQEAIMIYYEELNLRD